MSKVWDGEPAFPVMLDFTDSMNRSVSQQMPGMSLRDWFAGQAISSEAMFRTYHTTPDVMAKYAYEIADEMLKARQP